MSKWRLRGSEGPDEGDITSLMGEGTIFNGDLILEGGARIDGKVVGRVITKSVLVVGPCGQVETQELHAASLTVCGSVEGKLIVGDRLEVGPGGRVRGHVVMRRERLIVAPGGSFEGVIEYVAESSAPVGGREPELAITA